MGGFYAEKANEAECFSGTHTLWCLFIRLEIHSYPDGSDLFNSFYSQRLGWLYSARVSLGVNNVFDLAHRFQFSAKEQT